MPIGTWPWGRVVKVHVWFCSKAAISLSIAALHSGCFTAWWMIGSGLWEEVAVRKEWSAGLSLV